MQDVRPAIVVMGVAGCGKTSVASGIAARTSAVFIEGDAFHPAANVAKMRAGIPLTDEDRTGWLDQLAAELAGHVAGGRQAVLACSALKRRYRDRLRAGVRRLGFVFLDVPREVAAARVATRPGHFMPAALVDTQFGDLEPPAGEAGVLVTDATRPPGAIVDDAVAWWLDGR